MHVKAILRHPVTRILAAVGLVLFAVAMYLFQPWRLFTTTVVNETLPGVSASDAAVAPGPHVLARGTFISHEHTTSGEATVLRLPDGSRVLRIENLDTSDGPDLRVWLSDQPVKEGTAGWFNLDDGKHVELGALKGNKGNANYPIPPDADLTSLRSVTIWCARFRVSFGAAALT